MNEAYSRYKNERNMVNIMLRQIRKDFWEAFSRKQIFPQVMRASTETSPVTMPRQKQAYNNKIH